MITILQEVPKFINGNLCEFNGQYNKGTCIVTQFCYPANPEEETPQWTKQNEVFPQVVIVMQDKDNKRILLNGKDLIDGKLKLIDSGRITIEELLKTVSIKRSIKVGEEVINKETTLGESLGKLSFGVIEGLKKEEVFKTKETLFEIDEFDVEHLKVKSTGVCYSDVDINTFEVQFIINGATSTSVFVQTME